MKKISYYLSFLIIFNACSNGTKDVIEEKNVIHLAEAIENPVKMNLSEIVDSIKFVPISSKEHYIRDRNLIFYSKPYLVAFPGCIYNIQGDFVGYIGSLGEGPGEECNGWGFSVLYDEDKDLFYTKGDKIIQFDRNRKFTGKEVRITYRNKDISSVPSGLHSPYAFIRAQQHNVIINYPDSAYWMDENLQISKKQRICPDGLYLSSPGGGVLMNYNFSTNNDTTLFFNCFTDEISSVTENGIEKRWKIDLGDEKADNRYFLNDLKVLFEDELVKIVRSSQGNPSTMKTIAENSKLAELIDGKKWIGKAWETDRYVMINWTDLLAFSEYRTGKNMTYWAVYDKKTKETKAVSYLKNDMDGCVDFSPSSAIIGINDGVLMTSVWPYDVYSYVQRKKEKGEPVDPRLEELLVDYDEEDNPILVMAYLKE